MKPKQWQVGIILAIGVLAVATTAIFIRLSIEAAGVRGVGFSLFIAATRLTIATCLLGMGGLLSQSRCSWQISGQNISPSAYYYAVGAGVTLAIHFAFWITSLSFTSIAASTALVTTNPIWVALFSWLWFKEKLSKMTITGIFIALAGGIIIALGDKGSSGNLSNPLLGDMLALLGSVMVSLYFLFGREAQRRGLGLSSYIIVAYTTAALVLLPLPPLFGTSYFGYPQVVYLYILLMAIFSQLIGHTSFNWAVRWISPTIVTLAILFEPVGASFLGWLIFGEVPSSLVFLGGLVLLFGVAMAVSSKHFNA